MGLMGNERVWWRTMLKRGASVEEVVEKFLARQIGDEPSQDKLMGTHESDMRRWGCMSEEELKEELLEDEIFANSVSNSPNYKGGGNISHIQWRINAIKTILEDRE